ncbi:MAG: exo-alpha-sialidase [Chloroflexi bacterium]|nr:exo-alpha-sialidase [Chloroflexota bacterium]MBV9597214.1 exo-alpha-sialidase [Chloroflexota bacterium]
MDFLVGTNAGVFSGESGRPSAGIDGRGVRQLVRADGHVYAAAADGVYASTDGGQSWTRQGVDAGEVWSVLVVPDGGGALLASTQPAHLFRSDDSGATWHEVTAFLDVPGSERWCVPDNPIGARALTIATDPFDARRYWVGVEVGGVIATEDGGAHWSVTEPCGNADVHLLVAHPQHRRVLFATMGAGRLDMRTGDAVVPGPYRSDDGGQTWRYLGTDLNPRYARAMCLDPRPPHALTVPAMPDFRSSVRDPGGAQAMLFRSDDGGTTWRSLGDAEHTPSKVRLTAVTPDPREAGSVLVGSESGEVWHVSADARWDRLCDGLPPVQALLTYG